MSARELDRLAVLGRVIERRLTQRQTTEQARIEPACAGRRGAMAPAGLVLRKRGLPSNRKLPAAVRAHALDLVRARYADFGPTQACEKLVEQHGLVFEQHGLAVSRETLRGWIGWRTYEKR